MKRHVQAVHKDREKQIVVEYSLIDLSQVDKFCEETSTYFIQSWMASHATDMLKVQHNWVTASNDEKADYFAFLGGALFYDNDEVVDFPEDGYTNPQGSFSETMLRWTRQTFGSDILYLEPAAPRPPGQGDIDLVEITGKEGDYDSFRVKMWEVKGSDNQVSAHNSKVYKQLRAYPSRFFSMANELSHRYATFDIDPQFKLFLKNMGRLARQRDPKIHYGTFITFDPLVNKTKNILPSLHRNPRNHPASGNDVCHHLHMLLLPDFRSCRIKVWRALNLEIREGLHT